MRTVSPQSPGAPGIGGALVTYTDTKPMALSACHWGHIPWPSVLPAADTVPTQQGRGCTGPQQAASSPGQALGKGRAALPAAGPMNTQSPSSRARSVAQATGSRAPSRRLQQASSTASQNWRQGGRGSGRPGPQGGASSRQKNQARKGWQCVCRRAPQACAAAQTSSLLPWRRWLGSQERPMPRRPQMCRAGVRGRQRLVGVREPTPSGAEWLVSPGPSVEATGETQAPLNPGKASTAPGESQAEGPEERAEGAPATTESTRWKSMRPCCWRGPAAVSRS